MRTRGILLVTSDKGLCGPLNGNLFKLVTEIKTPAKYVAVGRKGAQFLSRTKRDIVADFSVSDRVPFAEVKTPVEFLVNLFLEGTVDTVEVIYPRYKNTLVQEAIIRPVLPLTNVKDFVAHLRAESGGGQVCRRPRHAIRAGRRGRARRAAALLRQPLHLPARALGQGFRAQRAHGRDEDRQGQRHETDRRTHARI